MTSVRIGKECSKSMCVCSLVFEKCCVPRTACITVVSIVCFVCVRVCVCVDCVVMLCSPV